jgi:hypothetical protein
VWHKAPFPYLSMTEDHYDHTIKLLSHIASSETGNHARINGVASAAEPH